MKIWYYGIDDATDEEGIFICTPASELAALVEEGAPTEGIKILLVEPEDRDETMVTVEATPAFIEWLDKQGMTWEKEEEEEETPRGWFLLVWKDDYHLLEDVAKEAGATPESIEWQIKRTGRFDNEKLAIIPLNPDDFE